MKLLVVASTFRLLDNYIDAIRLLPPDVEARMLLMPNRADPDSARLDGAGFEVLATLPVRNQKKPGWLAMSRLMARIRGALASWPPDMVLLTNCARMPQGLVRDAADFMSLQPVFVAAQHGFYQPWARFLSQRNWDHCLVFGEMHRQFFPTELQDRVHVAGLPKMQRLVDTPVSPGSYILFAGQDEPPADLVAPGLAEFGRLVGLPVKIRPHPQHIRAMEGLRSVGEVLAPGGPYAELLAEAAVVVTTASTIAIEAMVMGKPVVILRSCGWEPFAESGCVAADLSGEEMLRVLKVNPPVEAFLESAIIACGRGNPQITAKCLIDIWSGASRAGRPRHVAPLLNQDKRDH